MISHQYKCIFIHIPKTAGTSIEHKLGHFDEITRGVQDHRSIREIEPLSTGEIVRIVGEEGGTFLFNELKNLVRRGGRISKRYYDSYYKFTIVRNPWARVYSWYRNVMIDEVHKKNLAVPDSCSFEEFIELHLDSWALNTQLSWIINRQGEIPLDFVGRFERLEKDFERVCEALQIRNCHLPTLIMGNNPHYTQFYDSKLKDRIALKYSDEIELFNFEFGE